MRRVSIWSSPNILFAQKEREERRALTDSIDAILAADTFDAAAIKRLAHRSTYADVASYLDRLLSSKRTRHQSVLTILHDTCSPESLRVWRLGIQFGVFRSGSKLIPYRDRDDLRSVNTEGAACALACLGELGGSALAADEFSGCDLAAKSHPAWATASRRVRACYALFALVRERVP